jgi:hypothetical protein
MKEAEQRLTPLWFIPSVRKMFMDSCGYSALNSDQDGQEAFMRRINEKNPYPRFHLIVEANEVDYKFNLHFDIRRHISEHLGDDIPVELERINGRLEELARSNLTEPGVARLKRKFMALMMFGAYEGMTRPNFLLNKDIFYGDKKDIRRKRRSARPNLNFVTQDYENYYESDEGV